jgi:hypothetical protein
MNPFQESSRDNSVIGSKKAMTGWRHPNNPPPDSNPLLLRSIKNMKRVDKIIDQ